ncbi:MAG: hypothetical protein IJA39_00490 [Clostridia bacterium]|nr:hypothetical protein [Clostridia bacterium]
MKKALKIIAIVIAVAAAIAGIYVLVTKLINKKQNTPDEENYVSCSCEEEFTSETIA